MSGFFKIKRHGFNQATGWLFDKLAFDLTKGYVGHLDELVPELILQDDIYGENRLTNQIKNKDVGNVRASHEQTVIDEVGEEVKHDWEAQYLWWNSETQSNWRDGFLQHALQVKDETFLKKAHLYVQSILQTQDEDGYLGIYDQDLRFNFEGENGELWAQATLLRGLLGYYEVTQDEAVLNAVIRATDVTMTSYPIYESTPFKAQDEFAGLTHGLMFVDVVGKLYELTNDKRYLAYAVFLYEDYNSHMLCEEDIQVKNILNQNYAFKGHGPHTYEHLRALTYAAYASENPIYKDALEAYLTRLETLTCPSGGPIGDEWIGKMTANASVTGYEYCSTHELLHAYALLLQTTKDFKFADKIEWLYYNAALGAMHPKKSAIAYLKSDNSYEMNGVFQSKQPHCVHDIQVRYKYSPTHQDAAVCCVPNAGRITPYFLNSFYFESETEILAALFGPSCYETIRDEVKVSIEQVTTYPSEFSTYFNITAQAPVTFDFIVRKPNWATSVDVKCSGLEALVKEDCIIISGTFVRETIEIFFNTKPVLNTDLLGDVFVSYGPLVYAKEISGQETDVKVYENSAFVDFTVQRKEPIPTFKLSLSDEVIVTNQCATSIISAPTLTVDHQEFTPLANTVLRRVTFERK